MALSAFIDGTRQPAEDEIEATLAKSAPLWKKLIAGIAKQHAAITEQWNFSGAKYGWSLRLRRGDRIVLYLIPQSDAFLAGIVLGEKAFAAARAGGIRKKELDLLEAAPKYAEGRGIRIPITKSDDVKAVLALAAIKMAPH